jgi:Protein of unknown function (DUF4065)
MFSYVGGPDLGRHSRRERIFYVAIVRHNRLEPKLEAVLCRLCERLGVLSMTHAVKLPYLVDVVATHLLGRRITGGTHQTWQLGVVTSEVWFYAQRGGDPNDPFIFKNSNQYEGGKRIYVAGEPEVDLSPSEADIVDAVADLWGQYETTRLGRFTKALNTHLPGSVWGRNEPAALGEEAFARLSSGWHAFNQRLPSLDFSDRSYWGDPIEDSVEYLERELA